MNAAARLRLLIVFGVTASVSLACASLTSGAASFKLIPEGCIVDVPDFAGCGTEQQGLAGAQRVAISPDGKSV